MDLQHWPIKHEQRLTEIKKELPKFSWKYRDFKYFGNAEGVEIEIEHFDTADWVRIVFYEKKDGIKTERWAWQRRDKSFHGAAYFLRNYIEAGGEHSEFCKLLLGYIE